MKSLYATTWESGQPKLLPMRAENPTDPQLVYLVDGVETGGFCVQSPLHSPTCIVIVDTSCTIHTYLRTLPYICWLQDLLVPEDITAHLDAILVTDGKTFALEQAAMWEADYVNEPFLAQACKDWSTKNG